MTRRWATVPVIPDNRMFEAALMLLAATLIAVSTFTLTMLGISYEEADGSPISKLHPSTLIAGLVLIAALVASGNPFTRISRVLGDHTAVVVFVIAIGLMMAHAGLSLGLPFTPLIDTFGAAVLMYVLYKGLPDAPGRRIAWLIHGLMVLNALIGIGEFATGLRLTPVVVGGIALPEETRSSALLGHPLGNAAITGCYVLILMIGGGRDLAQPLRIVAIALNAAAMIPFGGRMATVTLAVMAGLLAARTLGRILRGERFGLPSVLAAIVTVPAAALVTMPLAEAGFFDRFLRRFSEDHGSAEVRYNMFEMFDHFDWHDLLLGPDPLQVNAWRSALGLDYGIESFWLGFIFFYGIIASIAFLATLFAFCHDVARNTLPGAWQVFAMFFIVASTSVSISGKTTMFSIVILLVTVLLRMPRHNAAMAHVG